MLYSLTEAQEEELIEALNAVDSAWRETYEDVLSAAEELLPRYMLPHDDYYEGVDADPKPLDFNE